MDSGVVTRIEPTRIATAPVVTSASSSIRHAALQDAECFLPGPSKISEIVRSERRVAKHAQEMGFAYTWDGATGPVQAILLDPLLPVLAPDQRAQRVQQILDATRHPSMLRVWGPLTIGIAMVAALLALPWYGLFSGLGACALIALIVFAMNLPGPGKSAHLYGRRVIIPVRYPQISFGDAMVLAGQMKQFHEERRDRRSEASDRKPAEQHSPKPASPQRAAQRTPTNSSDMPTPRRATVDDVAQSLKDLLEAWAHYKMDREAWYFTKPLLHDITGTIATTVAYNEALTDLIAAVDDLSPHSAQSQIDAAASIADTAWKTWHDANDYAARMGLGDRTPTERAALERLGKLVERLTRSAAVDPELPMIKRGIQDCLDKITTVSVGWADIASLPEIEATGLIPQITAAQS
ncbi:Uncharacterised protein [Mycobacteroides abscessus subsp. abscessus]|uniref:hypothetical protein n=1 Tax=Mycobacteroides abscessus TaxID=36809 RepID=UPI00092A0BEE|nr:hypothetical protein [Mycobacteroides abscessus]SHU70478.1 Uncharacterised protein [Mycobacteroides abscessus subsp. abscessus]